MKMYGMSGSRSGWARVRRTLCYGILICLAMLSVAFLFIRWRIQSGIKDISARTAQEYPGDRVEALMAYASSEHHSLSQRNHAIWALGMIGDTRALPLLETLRTGLPCDHSSTLCQHEVDKAIKKCKCSSPK